MYIYGACGYGRAVREILALKGVDVKAYIDHDYLDSFLDDLPVLHEAVSDTEMVVALNDSEARRLVVNNLRMYGVRYGSAIHPSAIVSPSAEIGEGAIIMPGAIINAHARIGAHCVISTGAIVGYECELGDFVTMSPRSILCGGVSVGRGTHICAGATVTPDVNVGRWSVVGAGTVCLHDIPDGVVVAGDDAAVIKYQEIID